MTSRYYGPHGERLDTIPWDFADNDDGSDEESDDGEDRSNKIDDMGEGSFTAEER
jgi:hypothetical protein